jgi:hypothetical protein
MRRVAVAAALLALALPFGLGDAAADCGGPTLTVRPSSAAPGATVTVTGDGFITECNDVNPPPGPHGIGGPPATDIELSFTDTGFTRTVLATVDADGGYGIQVDVVVPAGAAPGTGTVQATYQGIFSGVAAELTVTDGVIPATPAFTG